MPIPPTPVGVVVAHRFLQLVARRHGADATSVVVEADVADLGRLPGRRYRERKRVDVFLRRIAPTPWPGPKKDPLRLPGHARLVGDATLVGPEPGLALAGDPTLVGVEAVNVRYIRRTFPLYCENIYTFPKNCLDRLLEFADS